MLYPPPGEPISILLITADRELNDRVAEALVSRRVLHRLYWVSQLGLAITRAEDLQPRVVLLDVGVERDSVVAIVAELLRRLPRSAVLVLAGGDDVDLAQASTLAGAHGIVPLPLPAEEFVTSLRQVLSRPALRQAEPVEESRGRVVVFAAPKGGTGRTTLAINTAVTLFELEHEPVVLVDADYAAPAVDVALNLRGERTVVDLLPRIARLDRDLVESILVRHPSGVKLLLAPPPVDLSAPITPAQVQQLLAWLRRSFRWVVVDLGLPIDDTALSFLDSADFALLSIMPEMVGLRNAVVMVEQLRQRGYPPDRLWLVANRANLPGGLRMAHLEARLGCRIRCQIPNDQALVTVTVNRGTPLAMTHRRSPLAKACQALARDLVVAARTTSAGPIAGRLPLPASTGTLALGWRMGETQEPRPAQPLSEPWQSPPLAALEGAPETSVSPEPADVVSLLAGEGITAAGDGANELQIPPPQSADQEVSPVQPEVELPSVAAELPQEPSALVDLVPAQAALVTDVSSDGPAVPVVVAEAEDMQAAASASVQLATTEDSSATASAAALDLSPAAAAPHRRLGRRLAWSALAVSLLATAVLFQAGRSGWILWPPDPPPAALATPVGQVGAIAEPSPVATTPIDTATRVAVVSPTGTALPAPMPAPAEPATSAPTSTAVPSATPHPTSTPTATALSTATPVPTATASSSPTSTPLPTATVTAVPTSAVSPTAVPTPIPTATSSRPPAASATLVPMAPPAPATRVAAPSPTRLFTWPTSRPPTETPAPSPVVRLSAPALVAPSPGSPVAGDVRFQWLATGPLPAGAAYEVVWWNDGQAPNSAGGIAPPVTSAEIIANLDVLYDSHQLTGNVFYWTVILVDTSPYRRLIQPADAPAQTLLYDPAAHR